MSLALVNIITYTITFLIGMYLNRFFESRSRLITHYGHIGAGLVRLNAQSPQININTHSIVIRNVGRKPALNVKVGHQINDIGNMVSIYPPAEYTVVPIQGAGEEIRFERLLPKQSIMITYVYTSPLDVSKINTYVMSDEGMAQRVNVLLNRQWPKWLQIVAWILLFVGFVTTVYFFYAYIKFLTSMFF